MKQMIRRFFFVTAWVVLALSVSVLPIKAQTMSSDYATTASDKIPGVGLLGTGQGFVWTGVGMASTGVALLAAGVLHEKLSPGNGQEMGTPVWPIFGIGEVAIGSAVALLGLPMLVGGKSMLRNAGFTMDDLPAFTGPEQRGFGTLVELGGGIDPHLCARFIPGYHLNEHLFLGGGIGVTLLNYGNHNAIPAAFVASRFTPGSRRVAPYFGLDLGASLPGKRGGGAECTLYLSYRAGARIHTNHRQSLYVTTNLDLFDVMYFNGVALGFGLGYQF